MGDVNTNRAIQKEILRSAIKETDSFSFAQNCDEKRFKYLKRYEVLEQDLSTIYESIEYLPDYSNLMIAGETICLRRSYDGSLKDLMDEVAYSLKISPKTPAQVKFLRNVKVKVYPVMANIYDDVDDSSYSNISIAIIKQNEITRYFVHMGEYSQNMIEFSHKDFLKFIDVNPNLHNMWKIMLYSDLDKSMDSASENNKNSKKVKI